MIRQPGRLGQVEQKRQRVILSPRLGLRLQDPFGHRHQVPVKVDEQPMLLMKVELVGKRLDEAGAT